MKEKHFKFRESFGKLIAGMTDKQAGEFIKGISGYMFNNKPLETKDEYLKGLYLYAQTVLDEQVRNRENGRLGGRVVAEKYRGLRGKSTQKQQADGNVVSQLVIVSATEQNTRIEQKPQPKPVINNQRRDKAAF